MKRPSYAIAAIFLAVVTVVLVLLASYALLIAPPAIHIDRGALSRHVPSMR